MADVIICGSFDAEKNAGLRYAGEVKFWHLDPLKRLVTIHTTVIPQSVIVYFLMSLAFVDFPVFSSLCS